MAKPNPTLPELSPQRIKRFHSKVTRAGDDECWPWTGQVLPFCRYGYWELLIGGRRRVYRVHRIAYKLHHGADPGEMLVRHTCDNRVCCNPRHLILGTHQDNMNDMRERRRAATGDDNGSRLYPERLKRGKEHPGVLHPERLKRGEAHGMAKLTEQAVREIRQRYNGKRGHAATLGREYGVDRTLILLVVKHRIWKHVGP